MQVARSFLVFVLLLFIVAPLGVAKDKNGSAAGSEIKTCKVVERDLPSVSLTCEKDGSVSFLIANSPDLKDWELKHLRKGKKIKVEVNKDLLWTDYHFLGAPTK